MTHSSKRGWRSAVHGEAGPMAKMPQVGSSQQGVKRVGKQRRELPIIWRRTSRPSYRPRTEMPSLNHALSPNRNAIPLLVIRRHRRLRSTVTRVRFCRSSTPFQVVSWHISHAHRKANLEILVMTNAPT